MRHLRNGSASHYNNFIGRFKTGLDCRRILCSLFSQEIVMASFQTPSGISRFAFAAPALAAFLSAAPALASQGPGGGLGSASNFTQLAMAVIVWGASALVVGAGLIGAVRRR
jgi:hypothetical protein